MKQSSMKNRENRTYLPKNRFIMHTSLIIILVLLGVILGFLALASVFRPNQVGESNRGITLLFTFLFFAMGAYVVIQSQDSDPPKETSPPFSSPELELPRRQNDFNDSFIDRAKDPQDLLEEKYGRPGERAALDHSDTMKTLSDEPMQYVYTDQLPLPDQKTDPKEQSVAQKDAVYLQMGAYSTPEKADVAADKYTQDYPQKVSIALKKSDQTSGSVYKVVLGPFHTEKAKQLKEELELKNWQMLNREDLRLFAR